ncbi:chromate efflux transporter [Marinomonas rhizomae]|uniref:Chromate transporter n=1 Tax=Marinomonas rhizomae TaxID=491948 RepID=A0A366J1U5_9GAMM|nr:chromate efflux transporter [Marinomonas rhizomae]RBP81031.1 chromate transporter [Marinomonas rhizomae]RNF72195.1 chromate efflux transporter [Marinomonas rhizomae]
MTDKTLSYFRRVTEVFVSFLLLGFTSFGGPAAHLGYFNQTFIQRKKWASDAQYAQWVALSQIVPGPGSSQVGFALGYHRAGLLGAVAAFVAFTLPSFIVMVLLAQFGRHWQGNVFFDGAVHTLKLLAVVVVADACVSMWRSFCNSKAMAGLAIFSAAFVVLSSSGFANLMVLFVAVCFGFLARSPMLPSASESLPRVRFAWCFLVLAIVLFFASFLVSGGLSGLFADFYRAGALVFGGGHVVLPMLSAFVLTPESFVEPASAVIDESNLLLGYAAAQAVPGPMFTMASFLGAAVTPVGGNVWLWAGAATLAVFLSGLLLMLSAQAMWQRLSHYARFRHAVASLNAAVVGILLAALYYPIGTSSLLDWLDIVIAVLGFTWLTYKRPSIFVLILVFMVIGLVRSF